MELIFYIASRGDIYDKLVAAATFGRYSHVEIRFSDGMCFSSSSRDGGTRFKQIELNPLNWDIVPLSFVTKEQENEVRMWCESQLGKAYDWRGILCFYLPGDIRDRSKWYCSDVCACALREAAILNLPLKVSPSQMYKIVKKEMARRKNGV